MATAYDRLLSVFGVTMLVAAVLVLVAVPPANGYEVSVYAAYPLYFWALVCGAMFCGTLNITRSARTSGDDSWVFGMLVLLVTNAMLLLLPFVRGYRMFGRTDPVTHVGFAIEILREGSAGGNIYPPSHLLLIAVSEATGTDLMFGSMLVSVVIYVVYFGAMFYLLYYLLETREQVLFGLPFVLLPVFNQVGFRPFDISVLLLPLVVYLLVKGQQESAIATRLAFVVVLVAFLLYHPLTALFTIGGFSFYYLAKWLPKVQERFVTPTGVFSFTLVVFIAWYSNFIGILRRFDLVYNTLFGIAGESDAPVDTYTETLRENSPALLDTLRVTLFRNGLELTLFALGALFVLVVVVLTLRTAYQPDTYMVMLVGITTVFSAGGLAFLLFDLIVPYSRPFKFAKIGAVILVGNLFYLLWRHVDWSRYDRSLRMGFDGSLGVVLVVLVVLSTMSLYPTTLAVEQNKQVTRMELDGVVWLTENGNDTNDLTAFGLRYTRYHDALYGLEEPRFDDGPVPSHFGYEENEFLGESHRDQTYMILSERGRIFYPSVHPKYPEQWRFTPSDMRAIEYDPTVRRIYDNGDYTQYLVDGIGAETE